MSSTTFTYYSSPADTFSPEDLSPLFYWNAGAQTFNDDAGTIPATNGQGVAFINHVGTGNNFAQTSSGSRPTLNTTGIASLPAITFDGSNDFMNGSTNLDTIVNGSSQPITTSFVMQITSTVGSGAPFVILNTSTGRSYWRGIRILDATQNYQFFKRNEALQSKIASYGSITTGVPTLITVVDDGSKVNIWIDNVQVATDLFAAGLPSVTTTDSYLGRGTPTGQYINGLISEVFIVDRAITGTERTDLDDFFMNKYSI